jgi:hypothetical protein
VLIRQLRRNAAAGCALKKSDLKEVRLIDVLDGVNLFTEYCRDGVHTDRTSSKALNNSEQ